jgi:drug/metabolite transporter (DMT)-like permease
MNRWAWIALAIIVGGGATLVAADVFTDLDPAAGASLVAGLALLVAILGGVFGRYRAAPGRTLTYVAIWLAIAALLALIYAYRESLGLPID